MGVSEEYINVSVKCVTTQAVNTGLTEADTDLSESGTGVSTASVVGKPFLRSRSRKASFTQYATGLLGHSFPHPTQEAESDQNHRLSWVRKATHSTTGGTDLLLNHVKS